jgi:hypothetical protein
VTTLIEELRGQFDLFKTIPFPTNSIDDELSILHADLAEYDGYIAGKINTLLTNRIPFNITYDNSLEERIQSVLKAKEGRELIVGSQYLNYILVIKRLTNLATLCSTQLDHTEI